MSIETKHHEPIVYDIYHYIEKHCVGEGNAIPARDVAARFGLKDTRELRDFISIIRTSDELRKVIGSSPKGYYVCANKEEAERVNRTFWLTACSYLKVAKAQDKKAGLDGQMLMKLGESYKDTYEAFGE